MASLLLGVLGGPFAGWVSPIRRWGRCSTGPLRIRCGRAGVPPQRLIMVRPPRGVACPARRRQPSDRLRTFPIDYSGAPPLPHLGEGREMPMRADVVLNGTFR
ncbi:hypothetical protein GCM10020358_29400 [Amorphoplanes nipponensis]|uniref:Uncharacterized protein n=1 Tax=Actinoplanes nipponensis TaxID=135950 RepID=A0A919JEW6_9ACTN|nr:hypothetical protein Ani05nite_27450 [Actinoplanes nipponensis]